MAPRTTRHAGLGRARAGELTRRFGSELRRARTAAGLTQAQLARLADVSQSVVSRAERATRRIDWSTACALASATGHELSLRLYPADGVRLRDRGQVQAVQAIVTDAHPSWHASVEQPVGPQDRRAADLVLRGPHETIQIEVERALVDLQAQLRAAQLKRSALVEQFGHAVRLVIAVPGTRRSRRLVGDLQGGIAGGFARGLGLHPQRLTPGDRRHPLPSPEPSTADGTRDYQHPIALGVSRFMRPVD